MADVKLFHVTWSTHNSRVSLRMIQYGIVPGDPVLLDEQTEIIVTGIIMGIISEHRVATPCSNWVVHAYNICKDHVHMLIECNREDLPNIIRKLKGKSAQLYKNYLGIDPGIRFHLWGQKYNKWIISTENQYHNTVAYINNNRLKHGLAENRELECIIRGII